MITISLESKLSLLSKEELISLVVDNIPEVEINNYIDSAQWIVISVVNDVHSQVLRDEDDKQIWFNKNENLSIKFPEGAVFDNANLVKRYNDSYKSYFLSVKMYGVYVLIDINSVLVSRFDLTHKEPNE